MKRIYIYFFLRFYLFIHERQREAETQAEGEAGSMQGARCGTRSWIPGSHPEPKADTQPLSHPGIPKDFIYLFMKDTQREAET